MAATSRAGLVNPRLGTYFGIFASALACAGADGAHARAAGRLRQGVRLLMFAGPIALYGAIGLFDPDQRGPGLLRLRPARAGVLQRARARHRRPRWRAASSPSRAPSSWSATTPCASASASRPASSSWACCWRRSCASPATTRCRAISAGASRAARCASSRPPFLPVPLLLLLAAEARFAAYAVGLADGQPEAVMAIAVVVCALRHGVRRRHALAHLVGLGEGDRGAGCPGRAGHHRRPHGHQPAPAADDARQHPARPHAHGGGTQPADPRSPAAGLRLSGPRAGAARQALHPGLRQRRQPGVRADGCWRRPRASPPRRRCSCAPARRPACTRRASRSAGPC